MDQRLKLILGKVPVTKITHDFRGWNIDLHLGGTTTMTINGIPDMVDIKQGDLLTIYTEVLTKKGH